MQVLKLHCPKLDVLLKERSYLGFKDRRWRQLVVTVLLKRRLEDAVSGFPKDQILTRLLLGYSLCRIQVPAANCNVIGLCCLQPRSLGSEGHNLIQFCEHDIHALAPAETYLAKCSLPLGRFLGRRGSITPANVEYIQSLFINSLQLVLLSQKYFIADGGSVG